MGAAKWRVHGFDTTSSRPAGILAAMDANAVLAVLARRKLLLLLGLVAAAVSAVLSSYSLDGWSLVARQEESYESRARLLVSDAVRDPFRSAATRVDGQVGGYEPQELADLYTFVFGSDEVAEAIENAFGPLRDGESVGAVRVREAAGGESDDGAAGVPVVEIVATAPEPDRAEDLARVATDAFTGYVAVRQAAAGVPPTQAPVLSRLNDASGAVDRTSSPAPAMALVFLAVLAVFASLVIVLEARHDVEPRTAGADDGLAREVRVVGTSSGGLPGPKDGVFAR